MPNVYTTDIIHITFRLKQRVFPGVKMQDEIIFSVPLYLQNIDALQQHPLPSPLPLLLTSGKVEMLLFSKFSSSSSLHFAKDLGIADSLLYLRPRRLRLDRFPMGGKHVLIYRENHIKAQNKVWLLILPLSLPLHFRISNGKMELSFQNRTNTDFQCWSQPCRSRLCILNNILKFCIIWASKAYVLIVKVLLCWSLYQQNILSFSRCPQNDFLKLQTLSFNAMTHISRTWACIIQLKSWQNNFLCREKNPHSFAIP